MIQTVSFVAIGGAFGASARFFLGAWISRLCGHGFPMGVIAANVIGSFLMGVAVVYFARTGNTLAPLVMTGVLGGFTTFSAFSLEAYTLFERGLWVQAGCYVAGSVILSIMALFIGVICAKGLI